MINSRCGASVRALQMECSKWICFSPFFAFFKHLTNTFGWFLRFGCVSYKVSIKASTISSDHNKRDWLDSPPGWLDSEGLISDSCPVGSHRWWHLPYASNTAFNCLVLFPLLRSDKGIILIHCLVRLVRSREAGPYYQWSNGIHRMMPVSSYLVLAKLGLKMLTRIGRTTAQGPRSYRGKNGNGILAGCGLWRPMAHRWVEWGHRQHFTDFLRFGN